MPVVSGMKKKLLVIVGSTATGKTDLAIKIANKVGGELISADSRQVYKFMDIGTGKDLPKGVKFIRPFFLGAGYYMIGGVRVWGYDLVDPRKPFSVSKYQKIAKNIVRDVWRRKKLPVLVGGTGLYIKSVLEEMETVVIPKNENFRKNIEKNTVDELYNQLANLDPMKAGKMNSSDRKNPRRLVRGIEIAMWEIGHKGKRKKNNTFLEGLSVLKIGLKIPQRKLKEKIGERVLSRVKEGFDEEVKKLLRKKIPKASQAFDSIGYKQWKKYLEGKYTKEEAIEIWKKEEEKYSKRQATWLKKEINVNWYNPTVKKYPENVEKKVLSWYKIHSNKSE